MYQTVKVLIPDQISTYELILNDETRIFYNFLLLKAFKNVGRQDDSVLSASIGIRSHQKDLTSFELQNHQINCFF